jgi:hypothetical protein
VKVFLIFLFSVVQFLSINLSQAFEIKPELSKEIERINAMREGLVSSVQGEVSPEVFNAVCKPVGKELKKLSLKHDIEVKQASEKYRNPKHKPNKLEEIVLKDMSKDKELISLWRSSEEGVHYFRRINVKQACLNCHGSKEKRPSFIKNKYPMDKAYGFNAGDLRGIYSIFIPNEK